MEIMTRATTSPCGCSIGVQIQPRILISPRSPTVRRFLKKLRRVFMFEIFEKLGIENWRLFRKHLTEWNYSELLKVYLRPSVYSPSLALPRLIFKYEWGRHVSMSSESSEEQMAVTIASVRGAFTFITQLTMG